MICNNYSPYLDASRRGIYLALFTDPEEKKWKKEVFVNKKRHLVGTLFTIYKHPGDFFKGIFTILLQIQHENNFLPTSKHR